MAANTAPIFPLTPKIAFAKLTAANTATDGTGTVATVFTAGADGGRIDKVLARALGTNVATVCRVFVNNGSTQATATNNTLVGELLLPATSASDTALLGPEVELPLNLALPAAYTIILVIATAVSAGWQFTGVGGDY